jgi:SurA-like protein
MRRFTQLGLVVVLLGAAHAGEVVDRVIARVNHRVVMQSEFEDALRYQALTSARSPDTFSLAERHEAFEDLVDQALIEEQIAHSNYIPATKEDVQRQVLEVRHQIPGADRDSAWSALLERYGLSQADVDASVARSLNILRYLDARFRPTIHVDRRQVETYYREQFLPQLRKAGASDVPLAQVSGKIEEILVQQAVNENTFDWLEELRRDANLPLHAREGQ